MRDAALKAPAIQALLLQGLAFLITALAASLLEALSGWLMPLWCAALAQGIFAAALSRWRKLAPWWQPIQLLFPIALLLVLALQLPPVLFLALFLLFLALYWSTFRTQVPYYPSTQAVWKRVAELLPQERPFKFIDIGSGFGGLAMYLAALRHDGECSGVELAPLPWAVSRLRAYTHRSAARFVRGDYMAVDFSAFDVVFAYLSPAAMPALWEKAHNEMRPGALLLSFEFSVPGHVADIVLRPVDNGPSLYGWRM